MAIGLALTLAGSTDGALKINEVYYNISPQGGNQYVELHNPGPNTEHLDGKILTDEAGAGTEGVYKFPGTPGGNTLPVGPGTFVVIAVDAKNATAGADWECVADDFDGDNLSVPNLTSVSGFEDLSLYSNADGADNLILADGTDLIPPIAQNTVIDGVNFGVVHSELAPLSASSLESDPNVTSAITLSLNRCGDGNDTDSSSLNDFQSGFPTMGLPNDCSGFSFEAFTLIGGPPASSSISIQWSAVNGTAYQAQYTTDPITPVWLNVGGVVTGMGTSASTVDGSGSLAERRTYRVISGN